MRLKCIKSVRSSFKKGQLYILDEYPVEDYYFTAISDDKGALNVLSVEDEEDMKWINQHFIKIV